MELDAYSLLVLTLLAQHGPLNSKALNELLEPQGQKLIWKTLQDMEEDGLVTIERVRKPTVYEITQMGRRTARLASAGGERAKARMAPPTERWVPKPTIPVRPGADLHMKLPSLGNWPTEK